MLESTKELAASFIQITLFTLAIVCGVCMISGGNLILGMGAIVAGCSILTVGDEE